jgi:hypothetical protein
LFAGDSAGVATFQSISGALSSLRKMPVSLTTAHSHATFGEKVVSLLAQLEFRRVVFGRLDKSLCDKLIENRPFVRLQVRAGPFQ